MESERDELDLPNEMNVVKFCAARSKEISAMKDCIADPCRTKLVFQLLPVHMRRRAMSHNTKRLPKRLRRAHDAQRIKSGQTEVQSRRKRRRKLPSLLERTAHRRLRNRWLETHVWHAKRFHMTEAWGYRLPEAPCDKAFRACYRAGSQHCLLQDVSYLQCVQLAGELDALTDGFRRITSSECGLTFAAKAFVDGRREGSVFVYEIDSYPYDCIGRVTFIWKPNFDDAKLKYIWIFAHASFYDKLVATLCTLFRLECTSEENLKKNKTFSSGKAVLSELKGEINRFRLTGPLSHSLLVEALKVVDSDRSFDKNVYEGQSTYWNKIKHVKTATDLRRSVIVALDVEDPRLNLPNKRIKAMPESNECLSVEDLIDVPEKLSCSALWEPEVRKSVLDKKISTFEINKRRHESNLVPGEPCHSFGDVPCLPIILIQRPGSTNAKYKRLGYNGGWDVLIPAGYGMPFWISFVMRGARTGGIRETSNLAYESGFHDFHPDTVAGNVEDLRIRNKLEKKYFELPPKKRVNFIKLGISNPFICPWKQLLTNWNEKTVQNFYVLRNKLKLQMLHEMLSKRKVDKNFNWKEENCLIPVRLIAENKGKITDFAIICLLQNDDKISHTDPVESLHKDKNEKQRHQLRVNHKATLKRLRQKYVRRKKSILEKAKRYVNIPKQDNSKIINEYLSHMRELWLPTNLADIRHHCSRETVGYVTKGQFSFTEAKGCGIGCITLISIQKIIETMRTSKCLVLTRNILSRQYRFASLEIICD